MVFLFQYLIKSDIEANNCYEVFSEKKIADIKIMYIMHNFKLSD